jgi:hypothetical protein
MSSLGGRAPVVELLYFDGCLGLEEVRPLVRQLSHKRGARIVERRVATLRDADAERFLGSPTVRVNGLDVEPGAADRTDYGLKCRLYRSSHGVGHAPPEDLLRAAIRSS